MRNKDNLVTPSFCLQKVSKSFMGLSIRVYNKILQCILSLLLLSDYNNLKCLKVSEEAGRGAEAQSVTVKSTGCGFDPHSRK